LGSYSYKEINKIIRDMGLSDSTPEGRAILSLWKQEASSNLYRAINFVDDQIDYGY
jgi:high-affinity K+ transport system ATPase subunit B